jgi:hypothetical protein
MAGTGIAPQVNVSQAQLIIDAEAGEYSPLRAVAPHVAAKQIGRAIALLGFADEVGGWAPLIFEAEKELVRLYVREDFCGLCGRYTDHQGEH